MDNETLEKSDQFHANQVSQLYHLVFVYEKDNEIQQYLIEFPLFSVPEFEGSPRKQDLSVKMEKNMKLKEKQMKSRLLLQIHDELLIETHLDEFEEVREILQNEMMNAVSLRVPLNIDIEQGASWYEAK